MRYNATTNMKNQTPHLNLTHSKPAIAVWQRFIMPCRAYRSKRDGLKGDLGI
jgi:hypothetical protein